MDRHPAVLKTNTVFQEGFSKWRAPRSIGMRLLGDCMKKTILDLRATEKDFVPPDASGMSNMSWGSAYEVWIIERLRNAGLLKYGGVTGRDIQVNVRAYDGNGYMDALCYYEKQDIGVEIKTKSSGAFNEIIKTRSPDKAHYYQLMAYLHFKKLKRGWLIYIDREKSYEGRNREFIPRWDILEVPYDPVVGLKLEKRLQKLTEYKRNGKIPVKEPKESTDPRCRFCSHRQSCWGQSRNNTPARGSVTAKRIASSTKTRRRASK